MNRKPPIASKPDRNAIIRAVASSTAIETGKSVRQREAILRNPPERVRELKLAK